MDIRYSCAQGNSAIRVLVTVICAESRQIALYLRKTLSVNCTFLDSV